MHPRTRERATRVILAALIASDLSRRELDEVARSLGDYDLSRDLAELLFMTLGHLPSADIKGEKWPEGALKSAAYRIVQERRLPKKVVLQLMAHVAQERTSSVRSNATVPEMLDAFFKSATDRETETFMDMLESANRSDEYLKGIMGRR